MSICGPPQVQVCHILVVIRVRHAFHYQPMHMLAGPYMSRPNSREAID